MVDLTTYLDLIKKDLFSGDTGRKINGIIKSNLSEKDTLLKNDVLKPHLRAFEYSLPNKINDLTTYVFREDPEISPLDDLASFAVMGIDIKITPKGEVKVIEVNGLNSGMKGFENANIPYEESSQNERRGFFGSFSFFNRSLESKPSTNPCEDALRDCIMSYGEKQVAYIGMMLLKRGQSAHRMEGAKILFEDDLTHKLGDIVRFPEVNGVHTQWESTYGDIVDTLVDVEKRLADKSRTDIFFEQLRAYKPRSYEYTEEGLNQLIKEENAEYVVIKPTNGARGESVSIVKVEELNQEEHPFSSVYVVEPFIASKPIHSSETGQDHDGCMRYVVLVEEDKFGDVKVSHFGGYWRLSPKPISEYGELDAMRGNLSQGALAEKPSPEELRLVKEAVNEFLPKFYQRLVADCGRRGYEAIMKQAEELMKNETSN